MDGYKRYAIYYAPSGALWDLGSRWLGRGDMVSGGAERLLDWNGPDVEALTKTPQKYGLHGTLKPPFRLAEGQTVQDLHAALTRFAQGREPLTLCGVERRSTWPVSCALCRWRPGNTWAPGF